MAYRKIHSNFWTDPDVEEMTPEQKLFFLWLITNPSNNQIGLYEFSPKRCAFETGWNTDTIEKLIVHFENCGKVVRSTKTNEICITKFYFHNKSSSPKVQTHVNQLLTDVKDKSLIQYIYSMDTLSQEVQEKEEEEIQVQEKEEVQTKGKSAKAEGIDFDFFLNEWNELYSTSLKMTHSKKQQIKQRLKTFSKDEVLQSMHKRRHDSWLNTEGIKHLSSWDAFWRNDEKIERYLNTPLEALQQTNKPQSYANQQAQNQRNLQNSILSGEISI